jgi:mono/diheme cytochrome c family protein
MSAPSKIFPSSVLCLALLHAPAAASGDPIVGKALAEGWCAGCHIVSAEQTSSLRDAPSFPEIANRAESDYAVLEGMIADPHPSMLDFNLNREQIRDLLAYIDSLRAR